MIRSMTGFGSAQRDLDGWRCGVELRSVNNRFLDVRIKLPTGCAHLEEPLKKLVRDTCERGKVDGTVSLTAKSEALAGLGLSSGQLTQLGELLRGAEAALGRPIALSLSDLPAARALLGEEVPGLASAQIDGLIHEALAEALTALQGMREQEGEALKVDLLQRKASLTRLLDEIAPLVQQLPELYAQRLRENLAKLGGVGAPGEERILAEIALFAERCDVSEELTRFRAHLAHLDDILSSEGATGRKVDFLLQELNREANTLSVKSSQADVSARVVDIKSELEKLREQIQNVE